MASESFWPRCSIASPCERPACAMRRVRSFCELPCAPSSLSCWFSSRLFWLLSSISSLLVSSLRTFWQAFSPQPSCLPSPSVLLPRVSSGAREQRRPAGPTGGQTHARPRHVRHRPLTRPRRRLLGLQGVVGGIRGDIRNVFHRVGDFFQNRFFL